MAKKQVFYSFHYKNDVRRVAQIRNIGELEDNKPVFENDWEEVKKSGDLAIRQWIDSQMSNRSCVVVLIGEETSKRKWVMYEIKRALKEGKGLLGIYIHNIKDPLLVKEGGSGKSKKGANPFESIVVKQYGLCSRLSSIIQCYDPKPDDAYNDIRNHLEGWIEKAVKDSKKYDVV